MEIQLAKSAGFCFGVKRAVETVYEQLKEQQDGEHDRVPIYTYGPIIHNEQVVKDLEDKGVTVIENEEQLRTLDRGIVIIRSHGVEKGIYQLLEEKGLTCVDATCPFVKRIHNIVEKESANGKEIIIIGNPGHPEVEGIKGWSSKEAFIIESEQDILQLTIHPDAEICIVSQTTFNYNKFQELVEIITKKGYDIIVLNTICNATEERQTEARKIAGQSDAMIVIGDSNSSNTQKLFEICKKECENTYYVQTSNDMDYTKLESINNVGITAGASTPNNIIEEVSKNVRNEL